MAIGVHNNFNALSSERIKMTFKEIKETCMGAYILPVYVMLDLSGSMHSVCDKALHVLECLKKQFSADKCPCDVFLILSVINDCRVGTDIPKIVYSGFIEDFDFALFKNEVHECYGLTPLVNALKQVTDYGNMLIADMDSKERVHSCPVNIFITDYVENVSNDVECAAVINKIQKDIEDEKCLAIEFVLTESQAIDMNVKDKLNNAISFGGFRCRYNDNDINEIINALKLSSSTIGEGTSVPPRSSIKEYNDHLRRTLITKMHEYWDKYDN